MFDRGERSIGELARSVSAKKTRLSEMSEAAGPHVFESLDQAQHAHIVFTSNSLEGNSLTAGETSLILEKGIAVGGKSLRDHMEVIDHSQTLEWVEDVVKEDTNKRRPPRISVTMLTVMNSMLLQRTKSDNLSSYTKKRTDGTYESDIDNPPPSMLDFCSWMKGQADNPETACDAHNRLAHIQPFIAGNGPTARLLMNYILMRGGYPPIAIYERDLSRSAVIANAYTISHNTLFERLDATLDLYLNAAEQALAVANQKVDGEH